MVMINWNDQTGRFLAFGGPFWSPTRRLELEVLTRKRSAAWSKATGQCRPNLGFGTRPMKAGGSFNPCKILRDTSAVVKHQISFVNSRKTYGIFFSQPDGHLWSAKTFSMNPLYDIPKYTYMEHQFSICPFFPIFFHFLVFRVFLFLWPTQQPPPFLWLWSWFWMLKNGYCTGHPMPRGFGCWKTDTVLDIPCQGAVIDQGCQAPTRTQGPRQHWALAGVPKAERRWFWNDEQWWKIWKHMEEYWKFKISVHSGFIFWYPKSWFQGLCQNWNQSWTQQYWFPGSHPMLRNSQVCRIFIPVTICWRYPVLEQHVLQFKHHVSLSLKRVWGAKMSKFAPGLRRRENQVERLLSQSSQSVTQLFN